MAGPAELELGVREHDPGVAGDRLGAGVDGKGVFAHLLGVGAAHDVDDVVEVDVLVVVPQRRLRRRREDRLRQARAVDEARGQRDPADAAGRQVVVQAGPGQVAAHHALDREHLQRQAHGGAAGDARGDLGRHNVVRDHVGEPVEPPQRHRRQDAALVRDRRGQHPVVRGDPVAGDEQQLAVRGAEQVAHLAGVEVLVAGGEPVVGRGDGVRRRHAHHASGAGWTPDDGQQPPRRPPGLPT